jgi:iron complex transport system ATP-binding protein
MTAALAFDHAAVVVGGKAILQDVCLTVPQYGLIGVVGPNGAGKSTLVKAALGLMPLASGDIHLLGRDLQTWPARTMARHTAYVPQHLHSHWDLRVHELLQLGMAPPSDALIEEWELRPFLHRRLSTLSGGEQARAAVARALAHAPELLLADEPTAHLDLPHQHRLMQLLRQRSRQHAVLMVLHDLHLAATYCDTVAVVAQGRLAAFGSPQDVLTEAVLTPAYGAPVTRLQVQGHAFFSSLQAQSS